MDNNSYVLKIYIALLDDLNLLNKETESKALIDNPDLFITKNINFFTKSFMITLCAYLESFLKDLIMTVIDDTNNKLSKSKVAYNLAKWSVLKKKDLTELNDNDLKFEDLKIKVNKKELDDFISGSPYKTESIFKKIGIKLHENQIYKEQKEKIISIVDKRNKIVHHNDSASDIAFSDITTNILIIKDYIINLNMLVKTELEK